MTDVALGVSPVESVPTLREPSVLPGRRLIVALLVVIGLILGFGVAYLVFREPAGPSIYDGAPSVTEFDLPATKPSGQVDLSSSPPSTPVVANEPASARAALVRYLDAEITKTSDVAFGLVDAKTQQSDGPVANWQNTRANRLLPEQYKVLSERSDADGVELTISASRAPAVSALIGLVPAKSEETWRVVNDGGWRVVRGRPVEVRPLLPVDAAATTAGAAWLERAAACDDTGTASLQLTANLLGAPSIATSICKDKANWTAGKAFPAAELPNSTVLVSAYGPGVGRWARAVPVTGPSRYTIVLAPLGDEWRVMGLIPEGSPRP